jgi:hypothetical protein
MSKWQRFRLSAAIKSSCFGYLLVLCAVYFKYQIITEGNEQGYVWGLLLGGGYGFIFLVIAILLAVSVKKYISSQQYFWLHKPALIVSLILLALYLKLHF